MNKTEVNAKLQYVFEGLPMSKEQKEQLADIVNNMVGDATPVNAGTVKQSLAVTPLGEGATIDNVILTLNTLISNLKKAGIMANQ